MKLPEYREVFILLSMLEDRVVYTTLFMRRTQIYEYSKTMKICKLLNEHLTVKNLNPKL